VISVLLLHDVSSFCLPFNDNIAVPLPFRQWLRHVDKHALVSGQAGGDLVPAEPGKRGRRSDGPSRRLGSSTKFLSRFAVAGVYLNFSFPSRHTLLPLPVRPIDLTNCITLKYDLLHGKQCNKDNPLSPVARSCSSIVIALELVPSSSISAITFRGENLGER
jgi:hypothetical protein